MLLALVPLLVQAPFDRRAPVDLAPFDYFGMSVAGLDDLDDDGAGDILIADAGVGGGVWVVSGKEGALLRRIPCEIPAWGAEALATPGGLGNLLVTSKGTLWLVDAAGKAVHQFAGLRSHEDVVVVDDVDADRMQDVVAVVHSGTRGLVSAYSGADGTELWSTAVEGTVGDVAIAARGENVVVVHGAESGPSSIAFSYLSARDGARKGHGAVDVRDLHGVSHASVRSLGDVDEDGVDDFLVCPRSHDSPARLLAVSAKAPALLYELSLEGFHALSTFPDLSGDGLPEIVVGGIPPLDPLRFLSSADGRAFRTVEAPKAAGHFGASVQPVPDLNADSVADLVVGSQKSGALVEGIVTVVSGADGTLLHRIRRRDLERGR